MTVQIAGWAVLGLTLAVAYLAGNHRPRLRVVLMTAAVARILVALVQAYVTDLPDSTADARTFEQAGWDIAERGPGDIIGQFALGSGLYEWLIGVVYTVSGRTPLLIQSVNVLFGTLIVLNVYRIGLSVWGEKVALRAAWLAALYPTLILYSALTLREVAVVYPLTLGMLFAVRFFQGRGTAALGLSVVFLMVSAAFHPIAAVALAVLWAFAFLQVLQSSLSWSGRRLAVTSLALLVIVLSVVAVQRSGWGVGVLGNNFERISVDVLARQQRNATRDRTAYPSALIVDSAPELIWKTPARVGYFIFAPFPWNVSNQLDVAAAALVPVNAIIAVYIFRSRKRIGANPATRFLFFALAGMVVVLSLSVSNYGTGVRHAAKIIPLAIAVSILPTVKFRNPERNEPGLNRDYG